MSEEIAAARRVNGLRPFRATLAAGGERSFDVTGDWVQIVSAPVNDLTIRFDEGAPVTLFEGMGMRTYYEKVSISSATGQTFVVLLGHGNAVDGRATVNANINTTISPGNTLDDGGDVALLTGAAGQLLAADTDRLYAIVKNPSTNAVTIRVGTATVDATSGTPLEPGETLSLATTAAVYGFQNAVASLTVSASAIKQV